MSAAPGESGAIVSSVASVLISAGCMDPGCRAMRGRASLTASPFLIFSKNL